MEASSSSSLQRSSLCLLRTGFQAADEGCERIRLLDSVRQEVTNESSGQSFLFLVSAVIVVHPKVVAFCPTLTLHPGVALFT